MAGRPRKNKSKESKKIEEVVKDEEQQVTEEIKQDDTIQVDADSNVFTLDETDNNDKQDTTVFVGNEEPNENIYIGNGAIEDFSIDLNKYDVEPKDYVEFVKKVFDFYDKYKDHDFDKVVEKTVKIENEVITKKINEFEKKTKGYNYVPSAVINKFIKDFKENI